MKTILGSIDHYREDKAAKGDRVQCSVIGVKVIRRVGVKLKVDLLITQPVRR